MKRKTSLYPEDMRHDIDESEGGGGGGSFTFEFNNNTWYKKHDNGVLEQGGLFTPTSFSLDDDESHYEFPIPFKDENYFLSASQSLESGSDHTTSTVIVSRKVDRYKGASVFYGTTNVQLCWTAIGMWK